MTDQKQPKVILFDIGGVCVSEKESGPEFLGLEQKQKKNEERLWGKIKDKR